MENIIKEYIKYLERCIEEEKRDLIKNPNLMEFRKGKIYEMNLIMRDLKRLLDGDIFFLIKANNGRR